MLENRSLWFLTRTYTNQFEQSQKMPGSFKFNKKRDCTIRIAKTKVMISCADTAQLICAFVFTQAKSIFLMMLLLFFLVSKVFIKSMQSNYRLTSL